MSAGHSADYDAWPCDDYKAPITCWTTPRGRKQIPCEGCRAAFPNGPEVQEMYRHSPTIRDVPCEPCQNGYGAPHSCESTAYCPCDQSDKHVIASAEDSA